MRSSRNLPRIRIIALPSHFGPQQLQTFQQQPSWQKACTSQSKVEPKTASHSMDSYAMLVESMFAYWHEKPALSPALHSRPKLDQTSENGLKDHERFHCYTLTDSYTLKVRS